MRRGKQGDTLPQHGKAGGDVGSDSRMPPCVPGKRRVGCVALPVDSPWGLFASRSQPRCVCWALCLPGDLLCRLGGDRLGFDALHKALSGKLMRCFWSFAPGLA